jgi:hypothetical protein
LPGLLGVQLWPLPQSLHIQQHFPSDCAPK